MCMNEVELAMVLKSIMNMIMTEKVCGCVYTNFD